MKKIAILLVLCMIASLAAGCAGTPVVYYPECTCPTEVVEAAPEAPAANEAPAAEGALKTGLALVANVGDSKSATAEAAGEGKYERQRYPDYRHQKIGSLINISRKA